MSLDLPLAHLGHWYLWIPYMIPVVVVLAASLHAFRQQRREDREEDLRLCGDQGDQKDRRKAQQRQTDAAP